MTKIRPPNKQREVEKKGQQQPQSRGSIGHHSSHQTLFSSSELIWSHFHIFTKPLPLAAQIRLINLTKSQT